MGTVCRLLGVWIAAKGNDQDPFFVDQYNGSTAHNQFYTLSWDLTEKLQFDLIGRYMDRVSFAGVPKYIEMDRDSTGVRLPTWNSA